MLIIRRATRPHIDQITIQTGKPVFEPDLGGVGKAQAGVLDFQILLTGTDSNRLIDGDRGPVD